MEPSVIVDSTIDRAHEDIDAVLAVDRDAGDIGELPAIRQLHPIVDDAVPMLARAENGCYLVFPLSRACGA